MRSQGQVRFIKLSSNFQIAVAALTAALLVAWLVSMAVMAVTQYTASRDKMALLNREAKVTTAENRVTEYRDSLDTVATDLNRRQDFIEKMVEAHIGDLPTNAKEGETVSDSASEAAATVDKVSSSIPEAAGLARMEARQLSFVESLTRFADRRSAEAAAEIRKLGLNPNTMIASVDPGEAMGGPFISLATHSDGSLDPRFQRMGVSLARMDALERGLESIPQVAPANRNFISSGFGYRSDPFTRRAAFHAGIDFKGPTGAPIYAAAKGKVSFAGYKKGYGKCIEVQHGNGLMTRYAHMSQYHATVGDNVEAGDTIGAIGSTGRSTGPHLHFEVHVHNRPVNPKPFLKASRNVQAKANAGA